MRDQWKERVVSGRKPRRACVALAAAFEEGDAAARMQTRSPGSSRLEMQARQVLDAPPVAPIERVGADEVEGGRDRRTFARRSPAARCPGMRSASRAKNSRREATASSGAPIGGR